MRVQFISGGYEDLVYSGRINKIALMDWLFPDII